MIGKGTFQELSKSGIDFSSLLKHDEEEEEGAPDLYESFDPHQRSVFDLANVLLETYDFIFLCIKVFHIWECADISENTKYKLKILNNF